jgi:hypothetical protein
MRKIILKVACALIISLGISYAIAANYAVTVGSGTTFGSVVVAGVNYAQQFICDLTTPAQCAAVSAAGAVKVDGSAVTQPVSSTTLATAANQATEISSLATIVTNTGAAIPAGTNQIGFVGLQSNTTGGCTPTRVLSAATTNSTSVKGSAGTVCSITIIQNTATAADFRFYDSASAPTCSSATGVVANYGIQANTSSPGLSPNLGPFGLNFTTGIGFCLTAYDGTDTNNSNSVTGIQINIAYK